MRQISIFALILCATLMVACGAKEPGHAPADVKPLVVDQDRTLVEILSDERADGEVVALLPGPIIDDRVVKELESSGIPINKIRKPNFIRYQFYTNILVQLLRGQKAAAVWVALDTTDTSMVDYVDEYFFDRHKVIARYEVDDVVLVHVANEMVGGAESGVTLEKLPLKVNGFVTGLEWTKSGDALFFAVKNGGLSCVGREEGAKAAELFRLPSTRKAKEGVYVGGESGLIGLTLHPAFEQNGRLFIHYNWIREDKSKSALVEELTLNGNGASYRVVGRRVLLTVDQPNVDHNSGALAFGPDGFLYIGIGDGLVGKWTIGRSAAGGLRGKILRVDVESKADGKEYGIPSDNPFVGHAEIPPETWAWGFRNPWRIAFLPDGRLVTGDIGEDRGEEISIVARGGHHGWPYFEGIYVRNPWALDGVTPVTPLVAYEREVGNSVVCGNVYEGDIEWLQGKLIFGDHLTGRIWAVDVPAVDAAARAPLRGGELLEVGRWPVLITTFGSAPDGTMYIGAARGIFKLGFGVPSVAVAGVVEAMDHELARGMFAQDLASPGDRTPSADEVELGRALFGNVALAKDGKTSCATCHVLTDYGQNHDAAVIKVNGKQQKRNVTSVFNAHRQFAQFADYRVETVEEASLDMLRGALGLQSDEGIVAAVSAQPALVVEFGKVYAKDEKPVLAKNVGSALGAFLRSLATKSRWEEYLDGRDDALTQVEQQGLSLFVSVGCISCHQYRTLGGSMPQRLGLMQLWEGTDRGRGDFTGEQSEHYYFKVPGLLNVAKTSPYYHDSSMASLEDAIVHMAKAQLNRDLTKDQLRMLVAFLSSTTGPVPAAVR